MLSKIVWLWFENDLWKISYCRWFGDFDNHKPIVTYLIDIERAEKIRDIMYHMHKCELCNAPYASLKYDGATVLSIRVG